MKKRREIQLLSEFFVDGIALALANFLAFIAANYINKNPGASTRHRAYYLIITAVSFCLVSFFFKSSLNFDISDKSFELSSVLKNCSLVYMCMAVLMMLSRNSIYQGRFFYLFSFILFVLFSTFGRYFLKRALRRRFSSSKYSSIAIVLTSSKRKTDFTDSMSADWSRRVAGVALIDAVKKNDRFYIERANQKLVKKGGKTYIIQNGQSGKSDAAEIFEYAGKKVIAGKNSLLYYLRHNPIDEVFVDLPDRFREISPEIIEEIESMGISVHIVLSSVKSFSDESEYDYMTCSMYGDYPIATFGASYEHKFGQKIIKRVMDVIISIIGLVVSAPIILITAVPLLLESKGPLIFKQTRIGKNGRPFTMYKLRSMYDGAEQEKRRLEAKNEMNGNMFKIKGDPRITKTGRVIRKLSIDELPQFYNVLRGDMSLVGTRPPTADEYARYESHHKRRLSMKPGITGLWQVSGRSRIDDFEQVVKLDTQYIDNWSIWYDIKILFRTIPAVFRGSGAE